MSDPWGVQQGPARTEQAGELPARLARLAEVQATGVALRGEDPYAADFPAAAELPEVQMLMRQGRRPLDGAPLHCLLPAAWPTEHRTWLPDRLPRVGMSGTTDTYGSEIVALPEGEDWRDDYSEHARAAGLPDPPANRIWLLRSPWPRIPVSVIYEIIWSIVERNRRATKSQRSIASQSTSFPGTNTRPWTPAPQAHVNSSTPGQPLAGLVKTPRQ